MYVCVYVYVCVCSVGACESALMDDKLQDRQDASDK